MEEKSIYYYKIDVSYELPYNVFESNDSDILKARDEIYEKLLKSVPSKYEKFSVKLTVHQLKDNYNYLACFTAFFRSCSGLPMEEYVSARDIKNNIEKLLEEFFNAVDCEYRKINIQTFAK